MFDPSLFDPTVVNLSRLQFAVTAGYHFIFVPLTLGLAFMLFIMESVYVMTGRQVWRDMTKFWGILFGINFAMGVATGIVMEFQFGMNWAYYSHYVGDVFGAPLAIEGLMAFFLEATFIGLFFFGWDRMGKLQHLFVTFMVAVGSNLSALWILIANGWMQNPVGAEFNPDTMRMEVVDFFAVLFNPVAQAKFVHTVSAGYVTGAMFVLAVSCYYLLRRKNLGFAKRSFVVAASFGLASALSVVVLGDESGYALTDNQKMKLAAIEGMWETEEPPASFTVFGIPDVEAQENHFEVKIPWVMGLIATRSVNEPVLGILELVEIAEGRIARGIIAHEAMQRLQANPDDQEAKALFNEHRADYGYGMMVQKYVADPTQATPEQITRAAVDTIPDVPTLFWTFRFMVFLGFYFVLLFGIAFFMATMRRFESPWFLKLALFSLPLPWIAAELGWIVAEYGRQPWIIEGVLPTFLGASDISVLDIVLTLIGFVAIYTVLLVIEIMLMAKYIRRGPYGNDPLFGGQIAGGGTGERPSPAPAYGDKKPSVGGGSTGLAHADKMDE